MSDKDFIALFAGVLGPLGAPDDDEDDDLAYYDVDTDGQYYGYYSFSYDYYRDGYYAYAPVPVPAPMPVEFAYASVESSTTRSFAIDGVSNKSAEESVEDAIAVRLEKLL